ncbi:MAG TPA: PD-(D/E)XK nuclease family protein [Acidimicrobiales bacterium]|nr:PD-(D/E)XK nuclease family protein [Acidimicrobiales bacterium]
MSLPLPRTLSPSKVSSFTDCALAFRLNAIDRIPEPSSPATAKGTLVHTALERLFWHHEPGRRSAEAAHAELDAAWADLVTDPEFAELALGPDEAEAFVADAHELVANYLRLEDPDTVDTVGVELSLEAELDGPRLRGIIDRLDIDPDGELVVVDYKTGRVPTERNEQARLGGVHFYALLCEAVLGRRPARVRLLYLRGPLSIEAVPTEQTVRGSRRRAGAVWQAIERACAAEDFRPKPSALCSWCSFQPLCPAVGGTLPDYPARLPEPAAAGPAPVAAAG